MRVFENGEVIIPKVIIIIIIIIIIITTTICPRGPPAQLPVKWVTVLFSGVKATRA
jgi:hypothetical protein